MGETNFLFISYIKKEEEGLHLIDLLNKELQEVKEQLWLKRKWGEHLERSSKLLKEEQLKQTRLQQQLLKEKKDVERLEGISIANLFATLSGRKLEKVDQEQQELLAAELKYQEAAETVNDLLEEMTDLEGKLKSVQDAQDKYDQLLSKKEAYIHSEDSVLSHQLYALLDSESDLHATLKEYAEAINAGSRAVALLKRALDSLDQAKDWSTWDMFGGGAISTAIKHSHIDDSKNEIHKAQRALRHFHEELKDITNYVDNQIELSGLLTFADFFFDGFVVDWFVHGKIQDSYDQTKATFEETIKIHQQLLEQKGIVENKLKLAQEERILFLESIN